MASNAASKKSSQRGLDVVFAALPGCWEIARSIPGEAEFTGHAEIRVVDDVTLDYREEGTTRLISGQAFNASRIFLFKKEPEVLSIYFGDGLSHSKIFLRLRFKSGKASIWPLVARDDHQCNYDLYQAEYEFKSQDEFKVAYHVTGPKKGYLVQTTYTRGDGSILPSWRASSG